MSINSSLRKPSSIFWDQLHLQPSEKQLNQFIKFQALLKHWNKKVNLTRLINGNDYWINQVFDSLWPLNNDLNDQTNNLKCIDVGSGCGFPGIALAIALPNAKITLVDAIKRKTNILKEIVKELNLSSQVIVTTERIEATGHKKDFRGNFDIAMARAVANPQIVAEYLIPLLKEKGEALIYRGKWNELDTKRLNIALTQLKAKIKVIQRIDLPENRGERHIIQIIPTDTCPERYPRSIGVPSKRPLGS